MIQVRSRQKQKTVKQAKGKIKYDKCNIGYKYILSYCKKRTNEV